MRLKIIYPRIFEIAFLYVASFLFVGSARSEQMYDEINDLQRNLPDPCVLSTDDGFYLLSTGEAPDGRKIPIYFSRDLIRWEFRAGAVVPGPDGSWNRRNFWAPELYEFEGRYYLYYTAMPDGTPKNIGNRVGVAVADHPSGPYEDLGVVVPHGSIDGSVFTDHDGTRYLMYTTEVENDSGFPQGQIVIDKLVSPTAVEGKPIAIVGQYGWQEGAYMIRRNERYILFFSTGGWKGPGYCVRWAMADQPVGPFVEIEKDRPLLTTTPGMVGPGHGFAWQHPNDGWRYTFHAWNDEMSRRSPRFAMIEWEGDRPRFTSLSITDPQSFKSP